MKNTGFGGRYLRLAVVAALGLAILVPVASYASAEGDRNTALGLTVLSGYLLSRDKPGAALLAAGAAAYAYDQSLNACDRDRFRDGRRFDGRDNRYYGGDQWGRGRDDRRDNHDRGQQRNHDRHRD